MSMRIVGIDCAVENKNVAVAVGDLDGGRLVIHESVQCGARSAIEAASEFLRGSAQALIALDAPLGWPLVLGPAIVSHHAGEPIPPLGHALFRRTTDIVVKRETAQQPLDIGADRIARTAVAALGLLAALRSGLATPIPLAWEANGDGIRAIEVYPAATLRQLSITPRSYKKPAQLATRMAIFDALAERAEMSAIRKAAEDSADAFDAAVCVLAGADFLQSRCRVPNETERAAAQREGWIWFRRRTDGAAT